MGSEIAIILQNAMAPAFLLMAVAGFITLFANRLARIVDRARVLEDCYRDTQGEEHELVVTELRDLETRMRIVNSAIGLGVASGITTCILVAVIFLRELMAIQSANVIACLFIATVTLMALALVQFMREVQIAIRDICIREEFLERE